MTPASHRRYEANFEGVRLFWYWSERAQADGCRAEEATAQADKELGEARVSFRWGGAQLRAIQRAADWDDANIDHIAAHGVRTDEAEDILYNAPVFLGERLVGDETRMVFVGVTNDGRHLVVSVVQGDDLIRVCTAFPASEKLIRRYEGRGR